jgi:hypothetical protein
MHSVYSDSVALGGPETNSSSLQGGLLSAKAAPEPNTYRRSLRSRGSHELDPIGLTVQARVSPRPFLAFAFCGYPFMELLVAAARFFGLKSGSRLGRQRNDRRFQ